MAGDSFKFALLYICHTSVAARTDTTSLQVLPTVEHALAEVLAHRGTDMSCWGWPACLPGGNVPEVISWVWGRLKTGVG